MVQVHFERFHKDFLPFGITKAEAQTLLKMELKRGIQKAAADRLYSPQTEHAPSSKNTSCTHEMSKRERIQLEGQQFS